MKKIKLFDSVCFQGELEFLIFRLTELDPYVDNFIISDLTNSNVISNNKELLKPWESKITYFSSSFENCMDSIKTYFLKLNPTFEDILMISNTNEIPDLSEKDQFYEKLKFEFFVLEQKNIIGNYQYVGNELLRGTLVTNLSLILRTKTPMLSLKKLKTVKNIHSNNIMENGWVFSHFEPNDNFKDLLPLTEIDPVRTYPLIKHNGTIPLPKHVDLLPYFKVGRDDVKKHLFLVESDIEYVDGYDTITIINFSDNLNETLCEKVSENTTRSVLYLPNRILYGDSDLETFQNEYMLNETKRMFSVVFPQEQDIIDVIFKNEKPLD